MKKFKNAYYAVMTAVAIVQILLLISLLITAKIEAQVLPNSGSSISDKVNSIDKRLAVLEAQLNK